MPNLKRSSPFCQLHTMPNLSGGLVYLGPLSLQKRVKFWLKRNLDAGTKRRLKRITETLRNRLLSNSREGVCEKIMENQRANFSATELVPAITKSGLKAGDVVRVRSRAAIEATLDSWNELRGCAVMPDMWQFCGTNQRVFKVVERFVDERDYRLKKGTGIVLLDGLICQGTVDYGPCDRSCFYFWRVEWLERVNE